MKVREIIDLWLNCNRYLADSEKRKMHAEAQHILDAISQEWLRRQALHLPDDEYFDWPTTEAPVGKGGIDTQRWLQQGLLGFMGYQVGSSGLAQKVRQQILTAIFDGVLPPVFPPRYLAKFGQPESSRRLQGMAETIAQLTINAKRRGSIMDVAVRHYEQDLDFLYWEYYVEKFSFAWPSTRV